VLKLNLVFGVLVFRVGCFLSRLSRVDDSGGDGGGGVIPYPLCVVAVVVDAHDVLGAVGPRHILDHVVHAALRDSRQKHKWEMLVRQDGDGIVTLRHPWGLLCYARVDQATVTTGRIGRTCRENACTSVGTQVAPSSPRMSLAVSWRSSGRARVAVPPSCIDTATFLLFLARGLGWNTEGKGGLVKILVGKGLSTLRGCRKVAMAGTDRFHGVILSVTAALTQGIFRRRRRRRRRSGEACWEGEVICRGNSQDRNAEGGAADKALDRGMARDGTQRGGSGESKGLLGEAEEHEGDDPSQHDFRKTKFVLWIPAVALKTRQFRESWHK
jgi:hypothetical protein